MHKNKKHINEAAPLLKQTKLSSVEYQKAKKLKGFNADDYKWDGKQQLYVKESINEALSVKLDGRNADWDEYVNPNYVVIRLTNGKSVKISEKKIKGGKQTYQLILQLLDNYTTNPKAKQYLDKIVTQISTQLGQ